MEHFSDIIASMKGQTILVTGDIMLDRFVYGDVDRISPEGPVPVLKVTRENVMLGGAGNVISNIAALGGRAVLLSAVGDDANGVFVRTLAEKMGADTGGLVTDASRPTIVKTRYMARNQQLLRSDREEIHVLPENAARKIVAAAKDAMEGGAVGALIVSDYGKGVLTPEVLRSLIQMANANKIPVLVDPKGRDYAKYKGADIVTPNRKELAEAAGTEKLSKDADIVAAAQEVIRASGIGAVVVTRSEDGLSVVTSGTEDHYKGAVREVFDVSGAGDTVITVLALALASGASLQDAGRLANIAGGIAVSKTGTTSVEAEDLRRALVTGLYSSQAKICAEKEALDRIAAWKRQGLKVGFTNGCFDIVHKGHVSYMEDARARCDRLVLGLNSDASVRILKGPTRPINDEYARACVMAGLGAIDMVVFFGAEKAGDDNTPCALIERLRPDIFFKGGDYTIDKLPEAKILASYGGEVALMPFYEGYSTTSIIAKSQAP